MLNGFVQKRTKSRPILEKIAAAFTYKAATCQKFSQFFHV